MASLVEDDDQQALNMRNAWARLARHRLSETGAPVVPDVVSALSQSGPAERARLEEAARSYLTTGSIAQNFFGREGINTMSSYASPTLCVGDGAALLLSPKTA